MICVSIGRTRHKMVILEHRALAEKGAELVELRIDWLSRVPDLARLLKDRPTPCIVTCRRRSDRGRWRGSEEQRLALLRAAIVAGVEYVDLEDDVAGLVPRYGSTKRIISHHNFDETPQDIHEIHERLCQCDPDVIKLVTMANAPSDIVRLLKVVADAKVPTVGFCMGELGIASRVLCGKYGSPFSYATFSKERELAPGQLSFDEMKYIYRYDEINAETQAYGVLGDPIAHSLSPLIHNAAFEHQGFNSVYFPFQVPRDLLAETLESFQWLNIRGYSVTIPHKEAVLEECELCAESAREIGAANTLYLDGEDIWNATNTDYDAALSTLELGLAVNSPNDFGLEGKKILMLGAGGVARAFGLGLVRAGAVLTISNRTASRAAMLAERLGCQHLLWENRGTGFFDILINCTPVGMHPEVDETPFVTNWMREGMLVFDTIYNPENTLLLKDAKLSGCTTVSGIEMFARQAAVQYELFTGQTAPMDPMRAALRHGISAFRSF